MLVISILAIVTALAIPQAGARDISRLRSAGQILAADLDHARMDSIAHGDDPRIVVFDPTNHGYHVAAASDPTTPLTHPTQGGAHAMTFGQGLYHDVAGVTLGTLEVDGDDRLGFDAFGSLDQTDEASIELNVGSRSLELRIDPSTGEVTLGDIR